MISYVNVGQFGKLLGQFIKSAYRFSFPVVCRRRMGDCCQLNGIAHYLSIMVNWRQQFSVCPEMNVGAGGTSWGFLFFKSIKTCNGTALGIATIPIFPQCKRYGPSRPRPALVPGCLHLTMGWCDSGGSKPADSPTRQKKRASL